MSRILVCPPDFFGVEYEINPWMRVTNQVDVALAKTQWYELMRVLEQDVGACLERMQPVQGLPDMVFTANAGSVMGRRAVPSRFRHPERQREEAHFEAWFRSQVFDVTVLDKELYFEGAGDLLGFPDARFGGYRKRSEIRAYARLSEIFECEIIPVELVDSRFYHLDTCFCPLSGGELLYYPPAFDYYAQTAIADRVEPGRRIVAPEFDALKFACNAVCVGKHVVLPAGCEQTMQMLDARGYRPHPVPLSEFMKSGGSAKCLTLALD